MIRLIFYKDKFSWIKYFIFELLFFIKNKNLFENIIYFTIYLL